MTEQDLISMGYRKMKKDVFGKPFGYCIFIYELDKQKITQWFKSFTTKENIIYKSDTCPTPAHLKSFETFSGRITTESEFEFLTIEELL